MAERHSGQTYGRDPPVNYERFFAPAIGAPVRERDTWSTTGAQPRKTTSNRLEVVLANSLFHSRLLQRPRGDPHTRPSV